MACRGSARKMACAAGMVEASRRVRSTDAPCIVQVQRWLRGKVDVLSLAQGVVHWAPPPQAIRSASDAIASGRSNGYGSDDGMLELRQKLKEKVFLENGLERVEIMVTAGANQAFTNVVLALVDADDPVCVFAPYYFNHVMALQMTGGAKSMIIGPVRSETLLPDVDWLEEVLTSESNKPKMVVIVNPCNPTGVTVPSELLHRIGKLCEKEGVWLVLDNTYENFVYHGAQHVTLEGPQVINIFSLSKAYGMMGWRIGYIAYPAATEELDIGGELLKVQDTIPICPPIASQYAALGALEAGRDWVSEKVLGLEVNKSAVFDALKPLGEENIKGGSGAIYFLCKLPPRYHALDQKVVEWLIEEHRVCVIPGSSCGSPGWIRVAYANLAPATCAEAARRLRKGIEELVSGTAFIQGE